MASTPPDIEIAERELLAMLNALRAVHGEAALLQLPEPPFCNFCGRAKSEVRAMVEGLNAHICDACTGEAQRLFRVG
jgi:ClpX C4-type zinc finger